MKKFSILIFFILAILCNCKSNKESISYLFPTRMNTITTIEIDSLCNKVFYLKGSSYDEDKLKSIKFDSIIFKKNGTIYSFNNKVGTWKKDRTINLTNYKRKFFFDYITNNSLRIHSRYTINNDTISKQIRLSLVSEKKLKQGNNNEFDF